MAAIDSLQAGKLGEESPEVQVLQLQREPFSNSSGAAPWRYREIFPERPNKGSDYRWHQLLQLQRAVPRASKAKGGAAGAAADIASYRK